MKGRLVRSLKYIVLVVVLCFAWSLARSSFINRSLSSRVSETERAAWADQARRVRITRDEWGVPHIRAKTDPDAAFGLAYAHCEDDFTFIQGSLVAARGELGRLVISKQAVVNDYYVRLFKIQEKVDRDYDKISPQFRRVLDGYAAGVNYYVLTHPGAARNKFFPASGKDIAAGFIHKIPLFIGADHAMQKILEKPPAVDDTIENPVAYNGTPIGSNAHAVSAGRTTDGSAFLNVNSHQPWEGPVAWYEAHVVSDEGWNMTGGTFPGAPVILHGHNDHLGWAHTVNSPDLVDVYKLTMDDAGEKYRLGESMRPLEKRREWLHMDTGLFDLPIPVTVYASEHGPVLESEKSFYAVRVSGIDRLVFAAEQWFRMNKAASLKEWKDAMRMQAIPMFNTVYADAKNIFYVYNASLPANREPNRSYRKVLRGDDPHLIWEDKPLPFDRLPSVENPPSGFIQSCNSSPFATTTGPGNPDRARFPVSMGIETRLSNRAIRSRELLSRPGKISFEDFLRMKWDRTYAASSPMMELAVRPLLETFQAKTDDEKQALELLRSWNGRADDSPGAALAILVYRPIWEATDMTRDAPPDRANALREAIGFLKKHYGRLDVPLSEMQRMRRGNIDEPLLGGPDVLNAAHSIENDGKLVGVAGDSYVLVVQFRPARAESWSVHQYGDSTHPKSRHYADQMPLFLKRMLKSTLRNEADLRDHTECQYSPGEKSCASPD